MPQLSLGNAVRVAFGRADDSSHRNRRRSSIIQGVVTAVANRAVGVLVGLLSVPLTIGYLGTERFGVWALVGSILAWLRLADIGIGNGLNNAIARAHGSDRPDLVRQHVSTALVMLVGISGVMGVVIAVAWRWIDWVSIFSVHTAQARAEVGPAMAAAAVVFLLSFPLSVSTRVYIGLQEGKLANAWSAAGNVASLIGLILVTQTSGGLPWLVLAVSGSTLLVDFVSSLWVFGFRKQSVRPSARLFTWASARGLMGIGTQFFLIQIMALIVFESDNFVIAHFLGADHVPSYNVTYRLFNYVGLIQTLMFSYVWVAYVDAITRKDFAWVRRTFRLNLVFSVGSTLAVVVPLLFGARPFIRVWAGADVVPTWHLVLLMGAWAVINAYCSPLACLFAASDHMKGQLTYSTLATALNLFLSLRLVHTWGVTGVIAATVISYVALICVPATIDTLLLLKRKL